MPPRRLDNLLQNPTTSHLIFLNLSIAECLSLRLTSHRLQTSINTTEATRLFGTLCVKESGVTERMRIGLFGIGEFCGEVVIRVGPEILVSLGDVGGRPQRRGTAKEKASGGLSRLLSRSGSRRYASHSPATAAEAAAQTPPTTSISHWTRLFALLPNLHTLTISCSHSSPAWKPVPHLDGTLAALRSAFETASLPNLHTLRLHPIHPLGLLHLRWTIAFLDASWIAGKLWSQVTTLVLHVLNPGADGLSPDQQVMFAKVLHSYLESFSGKLVRLVFVWVGEVGICPLMLETRGRRGGFSAPALRMEAVRSLWLGNVAVGIEEIRGVMMERMSGCEEVWVDGEVRGVVTGRVGSWAMAERVWARGKWVWKFLRLVGEEGERIREPWERRGGAMGDEDDDDDDSDGEYQRLFSYYFTQERPAQTTIERLQRLRNG